MSSRRPATALKLVPSLRPPEELSTRRRLVLCPQSDDDVDDPAPTKLPSAVDTTQDDEPTLALSAKDNEELRAHAFGKKSRSTSAITSHNDNDNAEALAPNDQDDEITVDVSGMTIPPGILRSPITEDEDFDRAVDNLAVALPRTPSGFPQAVASPSCSWWPTTVRSLTPTPEDMRAVRTARERARLARAAERRTRWIMRGIVLGIWTTAVMLTASLAIAVTTPHSPSTTTATMPTPTTTATTTTETETETATTTATIEGTNGMK